MTDNDKAAEELRTVKTRVQRLEEARAAQPPEGSSVGGDQVLTPIERVVDRSDITEVVSKTVEQAPASNVIDDFEDEDIGEYSGDTSGASIRSYPVQNGAASLSIKSDGSTPRNIVSTSGLNYYPESGDKYRYWAYVSVPDNRAVHYFGASDADNAYRIDLNPAEDRVRVSVVDGGDTTELGEISASVSTGVWYEIQVDWDSSGGFTVELFEDDGTSVGTFTTPDDTYLSGGVGWGSAPRVLTNDDLESIFDFARTTVAANVIDDFEDAGITEYNGDTSSASVENKTNIPTKHGDYALEITGTATIQTPAGNLNTDAESGDTFETYHYLPTSSVSRHLFGVQDANNYYYVEADSVNGNWTVGKIEAGGASVISEDTSVTVPTDVYLTFQIEWASDGSITANLYDGTDTKISSVTGTDNTWSSGGHGWSEQGGSITSYFDYAVKQTSGSQTTSTGRDTGAIDDFEDNDISEYSGDTSFYQVQSSVVYEGSYALQADAVASDGFKRIHSVSGLDRYPQAGDTFEFRCRFESDVGDVGMYFSRQDDNNQYQLLARPADDFEDLRLKVVENGSYTTLASTTLSGGFPVNEWNRFKIEWGEGGSITISVYDASGSLLDSINATDSTFIEGGISWHYNANADTNTKTYYDIAEITEVTDSTGIIDDYEDNDLSEYSNVTGNTAVQSNVVHDGTYAIRTEESSSEDGHAGSMSGLPRYPQAGDTFQYWARSVQGNSTEVGFGIQEDTKDNGYDILFNDSRIDIRRWDNDSVTALSSKSVSTSADTWYRIVVDWGSGGDLVATLYDESGTELASTSATDTNYSGGGISVGGGGTSGDKWYFDTFEITASGDTTQTGPIDDFEDGDVGEYTGDTSDYNVQTGTVYEGQYALEATGAPSSGNSITSTSGLPRYPKAGDIFQFRFRTTDIDDNPELSFGVTDSSNRYIIIVASKDADSANQRFLEVDNGSYTTLASNTTTDTPIGEWHKVVVNWGASGDITIDFFDSDGSNFSTLTATTTTYTDGGIKFRAQNGNQSYSQFFDIVEIV
jgi:hypothetical protein